MNIRDKKELLKQAKKFGIIGEKVVIPFDIDNHWGISAWYIPETDELLTFSAQQGSLENSHVGVIRKYFRENEIDFLGMDNPRDIRAQDQAIGMGYIRIINFRQWGDKKLNLESKYEIIPTKIIRRILTKLKEDTGIDFSNYEINIRKISYN